MNSALVKDWTACNLLNRTDVLNQVAGLMVIWGPQTFCVDGKSLICSKNYYLQNLQYIYKYLYVIWASVMQCSCNLVSAV